MDLILGTIGRPVLADLRGRAAGCRTSLMVSEKETSACFFLLPYSMMQQRRKHITIFHPLLLLIPWILFVFTWMLNPFEVTEVAHLLAAQHDFRHCPFVSEAHLYWYLYFRIHWAYLHTFWPCLLMTIIQIMMHTQQQWWASPWNFPTGCSSLAAPSPTGTKRSACAAVIEGTGLETKKMTTDEQWAFIRMIFCGDPCKDTCTFKLQCQVCIIECKHMVGTHLRVF